MNVVEAIRANEKNYSDLIAIKDGDTQITFREFYDRVDRLSQVFMAHGVSKGDVLLAWLPNSYHAIETEIACLQIGAIWVTIHAGLTSFEVEAVIDSTDPAMAIVENRIRTEAIRNRLEASAIPYLWTDDEYEGELFQHEPIRPDIYIAPDDPARLRYTSGTTGQAKAAILAHRVYTCSLNNLTDELHDLTPNDNVLHAAPLTHASGALVFPILAAGGTNQLLPKFDAEEVLKTIERDQITTMFAVPTMLQRLFEHPNAESTNLSSLKTISYGGAPMPVEPLRNVIDHIGTALMQIYGLTEATHPITTMSHIEHQIDNPKLGSIGRTTPFCTIRLLDDDGSDVAQGEVGEMVVSGDNTMSGYWRNPLETKSVLKDGWIYTGDLAYRDQDGYYWVVDRKKDVIISGGFNVYSAEIEHVLMEHDGVVEVAVIGLSHDDWGEEVCAVVVSHVLESLDAEQLGAFCRERLAGYKSPKRFFIQRHALPKNNSGKILKNVLVKELGPNKIGFS